MGDLSDFQSGKTAGARMAGTTVAEIAQLIGILRGTVSKVMTAYKKDSKNSSTKHKSGRTSCLSEMDRRALNHILRIYHKTITNKIRAS